MLGIGGRGTQRCPAEVIETAWRNGAKFDAWSEYFRLQTWLDAFEAVGVDPDFYTTRGYGEDEIFPWQTISVGLRRDFFWAERERAYQGLTTPDCRGKCAACGAAALMKGGVCDA